MVQAHYISNSDCQALDGIGSPEPRSLTVYLNAAFHLHECSPPVDAVLFDSSIPQGSSLRREKLVKQMRSVWDKIQKNKRNLNKDRIIKRSCSVQLHMPWPVHLELSIRTITGLTDRDNHYQIEISFNNEVSNHDIKLFHEVRNFRFRFYNQDASLNDDRSNYFAAQGDQAFTSGKYYWGLDVDDSLA
ncbi:tripartite motif-containing protein 43B [Otolemur garnettii]|uniref:tripartite motif-containing protein 43B n=1 Tax=Otolemur garnettii TaxID=30611 RepID=UPI000C7F4099|nr:tripartite motif-containing protein 43B [Otolemur garnettii]